MDLSVFKGLPPLTTFHFIVLSKARFKTLNVDDTNSVALLFVIFNPRLAENAGRNHEQLIFDPKIKNPMPELFSEKYDRQGVLCIFFTFLDRKMMLKYFLTSVRPAHFSPSTIFRIEVFDNRPETYGLLLMNLSLNSWRIRCPRYNTKLNYFPKMITAAEWSTITVRLTIIDTGTNQEDRAVITTNQVDRAVITVDRPGVYYDHLESIQKTNIWFNEYLGFNERDNKSKSIVQE
ncbi:hypothetical protein RF11_15865 [Thelohanellus kitauei]|uniref:Uncharacterized protein n=1 Tax=Thelohanellus kitauei TaxID=669202 RepID=A0A0C2IY17_THEKT|nr:hypothetical protein RF11_15865 [Thelohanellus kitauei]